MFTADPHVTDLDPRQRKTVKLLYSMNIHQVATPELTAEDARCYVIIRGEGSLLSAHIGLYLPRSGRRFYYSSSSNPFSPALLPEVEAEARAFVEDMGFVLDELQLAALAPDEQSRWFEEHGLFSRKKASPLQPKAGTETLPAGGVRQQPQPVVQEPEARQAPAPEALPQRPQPPPVSSLAQEVVSRDKEALARLLASF